MSDKLSIARVAQAIDVSTSTLKRWYKWYEDPNYEKPIELKLPKYTTDTRGTRFFELADVASLLKFKEQLQHEYRGIMADFNSGYSWGQRGTKIMENKRRKKNEQKKSEGK